MPPHKHQTQLSGALSPGARHRFNTRQRPLVTQSGDQSRLSKFDDLDQLVLAGLTFESALLRTGPVPPYPGKPD